MKPWEMAYWVLMAGVLYLAAWVPVYVDEMSLMILGARGPQDGWAMLNIRPFCRPEYAREVPWALLPGRAVAWGVNALADTPRTIRLLGLVQLLLWLALAAEMIRVCGGLARKVAWQLAAGITLMGVLPLMMVLTRPETLLVCIALGLMAFPLWMHHAGPSRARVWFVSGIFLLAANWALMAHPKAMLWAPLWLVAALGLVRRDPAAMLVMLSGGALMGAQAFDFWQGQFACPGNLAVEIQLAWRAMLPSALSDMPMLWVKLRLAIEQVPRYLEVITFHEYSWSDWLPHYVPLPFLARGMNGLVVMWAVLAALWLPVWLWRTRAQWRDDLWRICLLSMLMVLGLAMVQTQKNFYDAIIPILLLGLAAMLAAIRAGVMEWLRPIILGSASLNAIVIIMMFSQLPERNYQGAHEGAMYRQRKSMSLVGYEAQTRDVMALVQRCGITLPAKRLVVDMFTYLPLRDALFEPIYQLRGGATSARNMGAAGVVMACSSFPDGSAPDMSQGKLCCAGPEGLMYLP